MLAGFLILRVWDPIPIEVLRLRVFDLYQVWQPRERSEAPVAVVDIDDESLQEVGQWPWPRTRIADLVKGLARAGAVGVAFDVIFAEKDRLSPDELAARVNQYDRNLAERLKTLPSNDEVLADAMRQWRVVLAQAAHPRPLDKDRTPVKPATIATMGDSPEPYLVEGGGVLRSLPVLEKAAAGLGMVSLWPSPDNVVRRVPLMIAANGEIYPSLALELLRVATGEKTYLIKTSPAGIEQIGMGEHAIPTDRTGRFWVYYGPHAPQRYISARHVLDGSVDAERLAGKLVFVGTSATGLRDIRATPLEASLPGVEVHAQALETILQNQQLSRPAFAEGLELLVTGLAGLLVIVLVPIAGPLATLAAGGAVALAIVGGSAYAFRAELELYDPSYALISSFVVFSMMVFASYVREQAQRRFVRNAFSRYLAPALVEQLTARPEMLVLGGEQRETTVLFSDILGFTTIAERFGDDAQGLTGLINRFLTPLSRQVIAHKGTIDKYMGDAIMAFWNAPVPDPDHPKNACRAALSMLDQLDQLNAELAADAEAAGKWPVLLRVGIGLNTGVCVAGNLGSEEHFNYSVLGDSVNLASRLEGLTRYYEIPVIIGSATAEAVRDRLAILELDLIRVKGKEVPERIFALLGDERLAADRDFAALRDAHDGLLERFRARDWKGAEEAVSACRRLTGGLNLQGVYDIYAERIQEYARRPPPADWDGVYTASAKSISALAKTRHLRFETGDVVFEKGQPGGSAFLITKGSVEVLMGGETQVAVLESGELLGEMSFLDRAPRSATVRTLEPTEVMEIDADALVQSLGGQDSDAAAFVAGLVAKLRATNTRLLEADRRAAVRVAPDEMAQSPKS